MKHQISMLKTFIIACLLLFTQSSYASHILGGNISYQQLSGNDYQVTLTLFRDCNGLSLPTSLSVDVKSQSLAYSQAMTLTQQSTVNITNACASATSVCNGGSYPGAEKVVYQGNFTLPQASRDWKFSYSDCCRSGSISSLAQPSSTSFYIEAMLNNVDFGGNNSAFFYRDPILTMQTQQPFSHNDNAQDWVDLDSLVYELVPVSTTNGQAAAYNLGYTATKPFSVVTGSNTFNTATGQINFTPNSLMTSVLVVRVSDYRNGILRGYVTRDMQYSVTSSTINNTPVWGSVTNVSGATYNAATDVFKMCVGSTISFTTDVTDPDSGNQISQGATGLPNNTLMNLGGNGNYKSFTMTWTATAADVGNHTFGFSGTDNACPMRATAAKGFVVRVVGPTPSISDLTCFGSGGCTAMTNSATPPYTYVWDNATTANPATGLTAGMHTVTVTDVNGCTSSAEKVLTMPTAPLSFTSSVVNASCMNPTNSVTLTGAGGTAPYYFAWPDGSDSATRTNLASGVYTVTISDAHECYATNTVVVTQFTPLTLFLTPTNPECFGANNGMITAVASGGTPPYMYSGGLSWSSQNVFTQLSSGTYTVSVLDMNGCSASAMTMLTEPTSISLMAFVSNIDCGNGTGAVSVIASGGTPPYIYQWSDPMSQQTATATGLSAGVYTVTVVDSNGCTASGTTTITVQTGCVFPGDANNDGIADNTDLLPIALSNALTGDPRQNPTTQWIGQYCQDWSANIVNTTINLKYVDCNGNGTIEASDTLAILANYGQTHQRPAAATVFYNNVPTITCAFAADTLQNVTYPHTLQGSILVGDAVNLATDITGIAFTVNYDASLASSAYMLLSNLSWLGTPSELYHLQHDDGQGHLAIAISRIDGTTRNGQGQVATCGFVIEDNVIGRGTAVNYSFNVSVSDIKAINNQNIPKNVNGGSSHIIVKNIVLGTMPSDFAAAIRVFPNPLQSNTLFIKTENVRCKNAVLYNALGQVLLENKATTINSLEMPDLANGIYTLELLVEGNNGAVEKVLKKIVVAR